MESQNNFLAQRLQELEEENRRLRNENNRFKVERGEKETEQESRTSLSIRQTAIPSYLRPTAASLNRATSNASLPKSEVVTFAPRDFHGKLLLPDSYGTFSFANPTLSSAQKTKEQIAYNARRVLDASVDEEYRSVWDVSTYTENDAAIEPEHTEHEVGHQRYHAYDAECNCELCAKQRPGQPILAEITAIAERTRLHDKALYQDKALCKVHLPFKTGHRFLRRAYRLAQEAYWHALRRYQPDLQQKEYLEGPCEVKFETGLPLPELSEIGVVVPHPWYEWQVTPIVSTAFSGMCSMRNRIAHPSSDALELIDKLIHNAQDMAVKVQDETRAAQLRSMRDEVAALGLKELQAIEKHLSSDDRRPWALHHQRELPHILNVQHLSYAHEEYGEHFIRVAKVWALRYSSPGKERAEYRTNSARKVGYFRETSHGRRASVAAIESKPVVTKLPTLDLPALAKRMKVAEEDVAAMVPDVDMLDVCGPKHVLLQWLALPQ